MKILIMSDSHGLTEEIKQLIARHEDEVSKFIHCGDSELMATEIERDNFIVVRGNCDLDSRLKNEHIFEYKDWRIFVNHGHEYNVRNDLHLLHYRAQEHDAHIVCFGHTHILHVEQLDNIFFINPGSIRLPRILTEKTYVILTLDDQTATVTVHELTSGEVIATSDPFKMPKK